jgi:hypothetical protein
MTGILTNTAWRTKPSFYAGWSGEAVLQRGFG